MTIQNRESFLDHVAAQLGRDRRTTDVKRPEWSITPQDKVFAGYSQSDLAVELEKMCTVIHTDFQRTTTSELHNVLAGVIKQYDGKTIVASSDERNAQYGLDTFYQSLMTSGHEVHLWNQAAGKENQVIAERADVGITFSDITLAESGTVVLWNNKFNGRSISLLPRTYIAIIPKSTLVPRMTQATRLLHERNVQGEDVASCVSFITGPSNSADIEMKLIVGVHGPVHACYILIEDA